MDRHQAAQFLGVSVSTLDRLASQGRLTRGRAKGKTRPRTDYDAAELQQLKSELESTGKGAAAPPPGPSKPPDSVGFRLDPYYVSRLRDEGAQLGMSPGEYARRLVIRGLEQDPGDLLRGELAALRQQFDQQRQLLEARSLAPAPAPSPVSVQAVKPVSTQQLDKLHQDLQGEISTLRESLTSMFYLLLITRLGASEEEAAEIVSGLSRKGGGT